MMNLWLGHVQINHVNSREVRLRAHHHQGSRGMLVRPGSAVFDPNSTSSGIYLVKFYPLYNLNFNFKCQINMLFIYFSFVINNWYNWRKHNYCYNFCRWTWTNWEVSYLSLVEKRCEKYHQRLKFNFYAHCGKKKRSQAWFLIMLISLWMEKRNRTANIKESYINAIKIYFSFVGRDE